MKYNITTPNFEPITVNLVIETPEELCDLLHRLNEGTKYSFKSDRYKFPASSSFTYRLWQDLDNIAYDRKLLK